QPDQRHPGIRPSRQDQQVRQRRNQVPEAGPGGDLRLANDDHQVRGGLGGNLPGYATSGTDGVISTSIKWTSSRDGNIGAGTTLSTSSLSAGVHTITASATDSAKLTGSAQITLTVEADAPPVVTITSPNRGDKFRPGQPATFTGTAIDSIDGDRTANMIWTSNLDGQIGTGGSFSR